MADFKRGGGFGRGGSKGGFNRGGGKSRFGGEFKRRDGDSNDRSEMFSATCAECKKVCEIPFKPSGSRPVYCSDCFRNKGENRGGDFSRRDNNSRSFNKGNDFRKPSFGLNGSGQNSYVEKKVDDLKKQVESISVKLDQILSIVSLAKVEKEEVVVKKETKETKEAKAKKKATKAKK